MFASLFVFEAKAQNSNLALGEWQVHTPGRICKTIEIADNYIYAGSESSFVRYDLNEKSVKTLSETDGFNGFTVSKIKYNPTRKTLIIAYTNGGVDLIKNNEITYVSDINRANIIGSKKINHILYNNNFAYLSCAFGMVVYNLDKTEIKETYSNIGRNGLQVEVYSSTILNDSIYLATSGGFMAANISNNSNLMDATNWVIYPDASSFISRNIRQVASIGNRVYVSDNTGNTFYKDAQTSWTNIISGNTINTINLSSNKLVLTSNSTIYSIDNSYNINQESGYSNANEAVIDATGKYIVADRLKGIIVDKTTSIIANSPYDLSAFRLNFFVDSKGKDNLLVTTAGYNSSGNPSISYTGVYLLQNGVWKSYNSNFGNMKASQTFTGSCYDAKTNTFLLATFNGLLRVKTYDAKNKLGYDSATYTQYTAAKSSLVDYFGGGDAYFLYDVKLDSKNNMWVATKIAVAGQPSIHKMTAVDSTWTGYNLANYAPSNATNTPVEILIDDYDNKWIRYPANFKGILVFNEKYPTNERAKMLTDQATEGHLSSNTINCFAKSLKGDIWVGTDKGICVFYNPNKVLTSTDFDAVKPIYDGRPLLRDKSIKAIAVDGANRKWIGTTSGVWLFSEDGTEALLNFTTENSPLPSDNIFDIKVNNKTGEVFFATDAGIASYRGNATAGIAAKGEEFKYPVKVFPNPVTPDYDGLIAITGLPANVNTKITDINGKLVYETTSNGGTASWNGITVNGQRASTGIYLVFVSNTEGTETVVSKFAITQ